MEKKKTKQNRKKTREPLSITMKVLIVIGAIVAILALAFGVRYLDAHFNAKSPQGDKMGVSVEGEIACLPHKGDGPHTLECAYGFKDDEGNYFALIDARPRHMPETGTKVKIDGVLVPIDKNDESQPYDIEASIRYAKIREIE